MNKPTKKDSEKLYVKYQQKFKVECNEWRKLNVKAKTKAKTPKEKALKEQYRIERDIMFTKIMKAYKIPERTLRSQIKKLNPGKREKRIDEGTEKVTLPENTNKIVTELMHAGNKKGDAVKIASEKLGVEISQHKALTIKTDVKVDETSFGENTEATIDAIWNFDKIAPGAYLTVVLNGFPVKIQFETLMNFRLMLRNEFNNCVEDRYKVICDKSQIKDIMVGELFEDKIREIKMGKGSIKDIEALVRMKKSMSIKDVTLSPNFNIAFKAAQINNPDLTKQQYIAAIRLASKGETDNG